MVQGSTRSVQAGAWAAFLVVVMIVLVVVVIVVLVAVGVKLLYPILLPFHYY